MVYIILSSIGSIASIIGLIYSLNKKYEKNLRIYALIGLTVLLSILTGISTTQYKNIKAKYKAIISSQQEARRLVDQWPDVDDLKFTDNGVCRGIVFRGIGFLEANQYLFPETYMLVKEVIKNLGILDESVERQDRQNLEEAAATIIQIISGMSEPSIYY